MQSSITFNYTPSSDGLHKIIDIAKMFKVEVNEGNFMLFEFPNLYDQIKLFLTKGVKEWQDIKDDMERQMRLISICGKIIKRSETMVLEYLKASRDDILSNAIESVKKYTPIARTEFGLIFNCDNFLPQSAQIMRQKMSESTPRMKNLICQSSKF